MKVAFREVIASLTEEKQRWDSTYPWIYFCTRRISLLITWLVLPLGLTANQATFISLVAGLAGCWLLAYGYEAGFIWGSIMMLVFHVMDCVDGNIARATRTTSLFGQFFDSLAGYVHLYVYWFIGVGLYRTSDLSLVFLSPMVGEISEEDLRLFFLSLGAITTITKLLSREVRGTFFSILGEAWNRHKAEAETPITTHAGTWHYKIYNNLTDIQGHDFMLVICALTHTMGMFLFVSAAISILELGFIISFYFIRAKKITKT